MTPQQYRQQAKEERDRLSDLQLKLKQATALEPQNAALSLFAMSLLETAYAVHLWGGELAALTAEARCYAAKPANGASDHLAFQCEHCGHVQRELPTSCEQCQAHDLRVIVVQEMVERKVQP